MTLTYGEKKQQQQQKQNKVLTKRLTKVLFIGRICVNFDYIRLINI